jgi:hypothetical protein
VEESKAWEHEAREGSRGAGKYLAGGAGTEVVLQLGLLQVLAATLTLKPHHDPEGEGRGAMEGGGEETGPAGGDAAEQRAESENKGEWLECTTVILSQAPSLAPFFFFFFFFFFGWCWWCSCSCPLSPLLSSPLVSALLSPR